MTAYSSQDLSRLNTLGVPAKAECFEAAASVAEVQAACAWARERKRRVLVLGGGSNIIPASHIAALVLKPDIKGIVPLATEGDTQLIEIGAGEDWHSLVLECLAKGWYGLENLSLIPGTVGAAPIQNIGAYGVELSQVFESLSAVHIASGREQTFDLAACAFGYRDSVFKNALQGQYVVTSVRLRLSLVPHLNISYPALADALSGLDAATLTPQRVSDAVCAVRRSKLPDPADVPNCGSFFKNPVVSHSQFSALRLQHPNLVAFAMPENRKKLAAGWLIEQAGWKGRSYQGVTVHSRQALVLTNPLHQSSEHILAAADVIAADVKAKFDVNLELEPQHLA